ncbi:hypothetical protein GYMLUDRAFT_49800 [Collybiopsis luxurians FD-317 M1]|uniref:SPT2-domain-containing protein n=1 Tax=Collybiopsis luxurians FD-317 M1 TaxID=944289 RepID=A0A0D0BDN2_9AGAR|nr:hypothetical protein GYMLUDRAFT_49800 [Collybiopsis luxurians FD-317 M1]
MSSFAALMAISATQTKASENQAQAILVERKRREAEARKQKLEQEKKEKEREAMLRLRHFEEQKKEEERKKKREEERKALEAAVERRKAAERDALLYGPPKKSSSNKPRQQKVPVAADEEEDLGSRSEPLTREELRERKLQAQLRRQFTSAKRSTTTGGYQKHGRQLPGGAVDVTTNGPLGASSSSSGNQSVKARLAALPNTLTKLNTVKRDTRTIDEILQDRAREKEMKTLDGDEALAFDDWFGSKKKEKSRPGSVAPASGENTPKSVPGSRVAGTPPIPSATKKPSTASKPAVMSKPIPKMSVRPNEKKLATSKPKAASATSSRPSSSMSSAKKRARSPSRSESPRPKRRAVSRSSEELDDDLDDDGVVDMKGLIWGLMGKKRSDYVNRDVFSDDEDMEADASALEREEKRSARFAKQEDLAAQEAERRHEEEKRRRKMMRG